MKIKKEAIPGIIAMGVMLLITAFWSFWSFGEMYHEGWWGPFYIRLAYLIPGVAFTLLTFAAGKWPRIGGWLIIIIGGAFTVFFLDFSIADGKLSINRDISGILVSGPLVFLGILFIVEARYRKKKSLEGFEVSKAWWKKHLGSILAMTPFIISMIGTSIFSLPVVLTRIDDGFRGASLIEGNGVNLIWAPEGPGWNWKQGFGGYPSWNSIALYGVPPIGFGEKPGFNSKEGIFASEEEMAEFNICTFLSKDGTSLETEPQNIWRMATIDEYLRSLSRHEINAGCSWDGESHAQMKCTILPDKETPLWAPDLSPIYYWTADEYSEREAFFVSYNGWVNTANKNGGNPRHSYRCVREVD
jgi:hypothetical protein